MTGDNARTGATFCALGLIALSGAFWSCSSEEGASSTDSTAATGGTTGGMMTGSNTATPGVAPTGGGSQVPTGGATGAGATGGATGAGATGGQPPAQPSDTTPVVPGNPVPSTSQQPTGENTTPVPTDTTGPEPTDTGMEPGPDVPGPDMPGPDVPEPEPDDPCAFNGPRPPPAALGDWPPPNLVLTDVATQIIQPTAIAAPRCDPSRLYFAEKWGRIRLIKDGVLVEEPALDMREAVLEGGPQGSNGPEMQNQGKRGLVGMAFHPNFEENGRMFVLYVADQGEVGVYGQNGNLYDDGDMTLAEYRRSADNPDTFDPEPVSVFLQFDKGSCDQCSQHNGGSLEIGVDGFLWASTGDPPPYDNPGSQDLNNLNGKILRFDISGDEVTAAGNYPGADPYVWSIGIRNAYKFSIDRYTGDMYVADVGENSWEEVTVELYGDGNKDHGWPKKEGFQSFMALSCDEENCLDPVFDYGHSGPEGQPGADNCIIGGYVYRGGAIPELQGAYIYGDFGSGKIRALQVENGELLNGPHEFPGLSVFMGCFGEDAAGEMYVCDYEGGRILRLDAQ